MKDSSGEHGRDVAVKDQQIAPLLEPVLAQFGLELEVVDIVPAGKRRLLRVVVDGDGPEGTGPLLDDIAEATQAISTTLDAVDVTGSSPYTLEVSSRGTSRPLTKPQHWRRNLTRLVTVTRGAQQITGRIIASDAEAATLDVDGTEQLINFADVDKALIQLEMNRKQPPGSDSVAQQSNIAAVDLDPNAFDADDLDAADEEH